MAPPPEATAGGHGVRSPVLLYEACLLPSPHGAGLRGRLPIKQPPKGQQEPFPETSGGHDLRAVPLPCSRAPDSPAGGLFHESGAQGTFLHHLALGAGGLAILGPTGP